MKKPKQHVPKINCIDCLKRPSCTYLCKAAEAYANQDYVDIPTREGRSISDPSYSNNEWPDSPESSPGRPRLTERHVAVATMINAGISRNTICKILGITYWQYYYIREVIRANITK